MSRPGDRAPAHGRQAGDEGEGGIWFTVTQAAAFIGGSRQTIYSWERRGHLASPRHDEHGRRIYSQQQIADAKDKAKQNAKDTQRVAVA